MKKMFTIMAAFIATMGGATINASANEYTAFDLVIEQKISIGEDYTRTEVVAEFDTLAEFVEWSHENGNDGYGIFMEGDEFTGTVTMWDCYGNYYAGGEYGMAED